MTRLTRRQLLGLAGAGTLLAYRGGALLAASDQAQSVVIRRGYTDCRYGQLHYLRGRPAGDAASKPTLVMLHQTPSSSVEYEPLLRAMAVDREVIAFDTPGNGMSDWPPQPLDMNGYALAFADGMEALGLGAARPVDVFGFHTGTLLAAELAISEPQRVGRVVLSGIPYRTEAQRQEQLEKIRSGPKLTEDGSEILELQRNLWEFVVTRRDPRVPLERAARIYMEKAKPMDRYWWTYVGVWTYSFEERFPLIAQPVLILQPDEDLAEYSRRAAELLSDVSFESLPGLKRDVFDVGAQQIATAMRRFLE
jgi:pimeloyl-ACP methyl ester carboxylesterase